MSRRLCHLLLMSKTIILSHPTLGGDSQCYLFRTLTGPPHVLTPPYFLGAPWRWWVTILFFFSVCETDNSTACAVTFPCNFWDGPPGKQEENIIREAHHYNPPYMTHVTRKQTLRSLSLSYHARPSFFWYDTNFSRILSMMSAESTSEKSLSYLLKVYFLVTRVTLQWFHAIREFFSSTQWR